MGVRVGLLVVASASATTFDAFVEQYSKLWGADEVEYRRSVFDGNVATGPSAS